jgi:hypothetical protein
VVVRCKGEATVLLMLFLQSDRSFITHYGAARKFSVEVRQEIHPRSI